MALLAYLISTSPYPNTGKHTSQPESHTHTVKMNLPVYSGNAMVSGDLMIFSAKRSFLLRKRIMEVSSNHLLLQIESNSFILSIIRFYYEQQQVRQITQDQGIRLYEILCTSKAPSGFSAFIIKNMYMCTSVTRRDLPPLLLSKFPLKV